MEAVKKNCTTCRDCDNNGTGANCHVGSSYSDCWRPVENLKFKLVATTDIVGMEHGVVYSGGKLNNEQYLLTVDGDPKTVHKSHLEIVEDTPKPAEKAPTSALDIQVGGGHYKDMAIQPLEYIIANNLSFPEGCVVKYVSRWRKKNGLEDLKKARHFIDVLIETEEKNTNV